ncbi:MAG: spermidine synthase [Lachnospiraceae bacterium]|nr:spermidine synthase [Lachnospiraceae bacterium]
MENKASILKNKLYLYITEFFAGMSVMAVELGASRLLAPYFSSSQIVWTIIIGTIMIAMALGNIYGGRSADKKPDPDILYRRILVAAMWIAAIPVLGKYVIIGIAGVLIFSINSNFLIWAAFAACMVVFVFPLFLLGTVTPSLVKYTVDSLDDNGKTVGNLGAANTIGSIIGTFIPTFVTIPAVGTAITFLIFAGILLVLAIIYFISAKRGVKKSVVSVILFILCCVFGHDGSFAFWENDLAYEGESVYNYLQVKEDDENVILSTNVLFGVQSILKKNQGLTGMYYDYAMAAPYMAGIKEKDELDMLILGMGTGTYATQCRRYFPDTSVNDGTNDIIDNDNSNDSAENDKTIENADISTEDNEIIENANISTEGNETIENARINIEGVEIDDKITDLAVKYFELPEEVKVTTYDGRAYLNAIDKKYDVIMVDAYQDITIPFQMSSVEFFTLVKEHLNENGVMVVNMNMRGQKSGNITEYLSDTIANVFDEVYTVDVPFNTNRELFATNNPNVLKVFADNMEKENNRNLSDMMEMVSSHLTVYEKGDYLMTDDQAPVELLGMRVIDEIIKNEVEYYKDIYNEEGIEGLLNAM